MAKTKRWDNVTFQDRFFAKVDTRGPMHEDGIRCWVWTGHTNASGYGCHITREGRRRMAHQAAYEEWVGSIPEGMEIDHLCGNRACCQPLHLEAVAHRTNLLRGDGWAGRHARKTHCPQGHEYTPENTSWYRGQRKCRACHSARERARKARVRSEYPAIFAWGNNERRGQLKGRRCRVLVRGAMRSVLVEFENGEKVVTSQRALRYGHLDVEDSRAAIRLLEVEV